MHSHRISFHFLRYILAFVFLWFGFSQYSDVTAWAGFVPTWATFLAPAGTLLLLNATFEIIAGALLAFNILTRWVALLLGAHLLLIAFSVGFSAVGVRDMGLAVATLVLSVLAFENRVVPVKMPTIKTIE